jgi:hypothetical protein
MLNIKDVTFKLLMAFGLLFTVGVGLICQYDASNPRNCVNNDLLPLSTTGYLLWKGGGTDMPPCASQQTGLYDDIDKT